MSKKERERGRKKGRERKRESRSNSATEVEKGGMILMENVRETNENERRGEDRRRRGREGGKGRRVREMMCLSPERTARRMSRTGEGLQRDRERKLVPDPI